MSTSVSSFARAVCQAHEERAGFTATQTIASGQLKIEADIRQCRHRSTRVGFTTYENPWTELEEALSGQAEYTGDELCGLTIYREAGKTWIIDPTTDTAIRKLGSHLYEPIPGISALGELSFLNRLTRDFLLRDLGEHPLGDVRIRRIALKPKQVYRANLLSTVTFPIRSATVDFDTETYFPYSISLSPSENSPAASILGPRASIVVTYSDVQDLENAAEIEPFSPQADAHVFQESVVAVEDLENLLPFCVPLHVVLERGFSEEGHAVLVTLDTEQERAYITAHFTATEPVSDEDGQQARLTITCGNYMSRNMARRRITLSEQGIPASEDSESVKLLDRSTLWEARLPGVDTKHAPIDAFFETAGVFWFLSGSGLESDTIQTLAEEILNACSETG